MVVYYYVDVAGKTYPSLRRAEFDEFLNRIEKQIRIRHFIEGRRWMRPFQYFARTAAQEELRTKKYLLERYGLTEELLRDFKRYSHRITLDNSSESRIVAETVTNRADQRNNGHQGPLPIVSYVPVWQTLM